MVIPMPDITTNNKTVGDYKLNHDYGSYNTDPVVILLCCLIIERT